jgi:hypothetical protein
MISTKTTQAERLYENDEEDLNITEHVIRTTAEPKIGRNCLDAIGSCWF